MKDRNYLINAYNATSTDDGKGELETYEAWLERQLLNRIERIEELEKAIVSEPELKEGKNMYIEQPGKCGYISNPGVIGPEGTIP
jgi:hypothetical protein